MAEFFKLAPQLNTDYGEVSLTWPKDAEGNDQVIGILKPLIFCNEIGDMSEYEASIVLVYGDGQYLGKYQVEGGTVSLHESDKGRHLYLVKVIVPAEGASFYENERTISTDHLNDYSTQGDKLTYRIVKGGEIVDRAIVYMDYEDILLKDADRKLRICYNPKVSSLKTTIAEQKVDTLDGNYPFFVRKGGPGYKEIPIGGLLTYAVDRDPKWQETGYPDRRLNTANRQVRFSPIDEVAREREYKLEVEKWLNNGKEKFLRLGPEGSYNVRLMKISMTPVEALGRRLHEFSATAYESSAIVRPAAEVNWKQSGPQTIQIKVSAGEQVRFLASWFPEWYELLGFTITPDNGDTLYHTHYNKTLRGFADTGIQINPLEDAFLSIRVVQGSVTITLQYTKEVIDA